MITGGSGPRRSPGSGEAAEGRDAPRAAPGLRRAFSRLLQMLDASGRKEFGVLVGLLSLASVMEAAGIGVILPYLRLLTERELAMTHPLLEPVVEGLGLTSHGPVAVLVSLALIVLFIAKNGFIGYVWNRAFGFIYRNHARLSSRLLAGYLRAPYTFHLEENTSALIRNTTHEPERVFKGAMKSGLVLLSEGLVVVGVMAVLFWAQPVIAAVVVSLAGFLGWRLTSAFRHRLDVVGRERAGRQASAMQVAQEGLGALKEIRLTGRERFFEDRFRDHVDTLAETLRLNEIIALLPRLVLETGAILVMAGIGAFLVVSEVTLEAAFPIIGIFGVALVRLMPSLKRLVKNLNLLRFEAGAVEVLHTELERLRRLRPDVGDGSGAGSGDGGITPLHVEREIVLSGVSYRYPDADEPAIRELSLRIAAGESVGVVGQSGSGKTTFLNLLLGLLEPQEGEFLVDGREVYRRLPSWQRAIGYIPQESYLLDDSVRRNVALGLPDDRIDDDRVWGALEAAQLANFVAGLPGGLEARAGERGIRLSGGQRQRIAIARALYHEPEVLLLDEATSSLDRETERRIADSVARLAGDRTLVIVTHRLPTVAHCDEIHLMRSGRIAASGTYSELLEESAEFRSLWHPGPDEPTAGEVVREHGG